MKATHAMKATRLLLRAAVFAAALWLLLPVLQTYNPVILEWFNTLLDDSLVDRRTLDTVAGMHHEIFWPVVLPRLVLLVALLVGARLAFRRIR